MRETGKLRRSLASLLAVCMLFTLLPALTLAEGAQGGGGVTITAFDPLEEATAEQTVPFGTALADLNLPAALTARGYALSADTETPPEATALTVEGVTWEPDMPYEGAADSYTFTASATGYACAEGIGWPTLAVTVEPATVPNPDPDPAPEPEPSPAPEPEFSAYDGVVALFAALHRPEDVGAMADGEKEALSAQIGAATDALFALTDGDYDRFMNEHVAYMELVAALQAALTGGVETLAGGAVSESQTWTGSIDTDVTITGGTAEAPVVITVTGTVTTNRMITVASGYVLFTGGGTIQWKYNYLDNALVVAAGATAVLEDITLDGDGKSFSRSALLIQGTGTLGSGATVQNFISLGSSGTAAGNKGVIAAHGGTLNIKEGAVITGNRGKSGIIALYDLDEEGKTASNAKVNMTGGNIFGNTVGSDTMGVIWNWAGTLEITGASSITAEGTEYAVYTQGNPGSGGRKYGATTTIRGGRFRGDATGAICAGKTAGCDSVTRLYGGVFSGKNAAAVRDGSINVSGGTFNGTDYALDLQNGSIIVSNGEFFGGITAYNGTVTTSAQNVIVGDTRATAKKWTAYPPLNTYHYVAIGSVYTSSHTHGCCIYSPSGPVVDGVCSCGQRGTATLTIQGETSFPYTGSAITPATVVYSDGWVGSRDASVTYTNNTGAGAAQGQAVIEGKTATLPFTIQRAGNSVTGLTCANVVFGGTPSPSVSAAFGASTAQYTYSQTEGGTYGAWNTTNGVGTWYLKATVPETANYAGAEAVKSFSVTPATMTGVKVTGYSGVYDGTPHGITVTGAPSGATVYYSLTSNSGWGTTQPEIKNVTASTTVYYKVTKANHNDVTGSATVTINQKQIAVNWGTTTSWTYDGKSHAPTATAASGVSGETVNLTVAGARTNVGGPYTATAGISTVTGGSAGNYTLKSDTTTKNFTITRAEVTPPTISGKVYTGQKLTAEVPASALYTVTTNDGGVNAWNYSVVLTLTDSTNYKWSAADTADITLTFTISQAENAWTTQPAFSGWTYGDNAKTPTYGAKFGTVKVEYKPKTAQDTGYSTTVPTSAGTYTVRFSVTATASYTELSKTVDFTIAQKVVDLTWSGGGGTTYNGQPRSVTATATGLVRGDTCTVTVTDGGKTGAGTYTARATGLSNPNYKLPTSGTTQSYKINPAALTVSVKNGLTIGKVYNGETGVEASDVTDGLVVNGLQNGETATASGTWAYADAHAGTGKTVNVTDVSITYDTAESKNYSFAAVPLTTSGTITRKPITPAIAFEGGPWTYTGSAITPSYTVKDGDTALTTGDYAAAFSDHVNAGAGKLAVTAKTDGNYDFTETTETFTISPKQIAAVWGSVTSWEYDGDAHAPTATAETGVSDETVTLAVTGGQKNYSADAYTATASISSVTGGQVRAENYTLTGTTKDFTITQKAVGLDWSGYTELVYTGSPVNVTATATELVENDTCGVTVDNGDKIDAGTYTAEATGLENTNYKLPQGEGAKKEYTIAKAPVSFTVSNNAYNYDASAKSATVEQTEGETPNVAGQFTVSYKQGQDTVDQPTSVGEYEIWVALTSGNFKFNGEQDTTRSKQVDTLTINGSAYPEQDKITWPTAEELTYGGALSASALTGGGTTSRGGAGTFTWKEPEAIPTVTDKECAVVFTPNDTNYSTVEHTVPITVNPKELTISGAAATDRDYVPDNKAVTVSGGTLEGVVTRNGTEDDVTLDAGKAAGTVETPDAGNDKAVTVTGYALTGTAADNYTLKQPEYVTVNIAPAQGSVTVTMEDWTYGETAKSPAPTSDTNDTESVSYRYTGTKLDESDYDSESVPTDAGTYTVTATFAATPNYKESIATAEFTINPKSIMVQWRETTHDYDGTAKSPDLTLVDVEAADQNNVSATLSGGGKTDAGSYPVTAALTGTRAFNYRLTNPSGTLLIQKVFVTFTVTDDTVEHDGTVKRATVTATANNANFTYFTISYQNSAGEVVTAPTEAGSYEIWAEITDTNYCYTDSTGGESRKIGVLTIYQSTPPEKYDVSFVPGEGDQITGNTNPLGEALAGTLRVLPDCGFIRTGWVFTGWKLNGLIYQPGETFVQPAQSLTFTAQWVQATHEIGGVVDQKGKPVENAVVTLMRGPWRIKETTTDQYGNFTFSNVVSGRYNLVGSYNGVVTTIKVIMEAEDVTGAKIHLPKGKTNSVVAVVKGTPEIVVGNLETTFQDGNDEVYTVTDRGVVDQGGTVEIKLTAQKVMANDTDDKQAAIEEKAQNIGLYLDLSLEKTVNNDLPTSLFTSGNVLLESVIPLPAYLQGKYRYTVYRSHDPDGEGEEPSSVDAITETPNEAGEYIEVSEDKTSLTIHARYYSLYAIAWTNPASGGDFAAYPPIVTDTEHGTVEVSPRHTSNGQKASITPIPDKGYKVGTVTVTDKGGKELKVTENGDGTWSFIQPAGSVTITVTFIPDGSLRPAWNPFTDVEDGDWYYDSVKYVYERGLMNGTGETMFSPGLSTTRGMVVAILWRLEQEPDSTMVMAFRDVDVDSCYYQAVGWGLEQEIVKGYTPTTFGPEDTVTRQELAAILYRYAQYKGIVVSASDDLAAFTDWPDPWAEDAMRWAVGAGITAGKGNGVLDPRGPATRAQVAAMLTRFLGNK